jgi:L-alanine-DL-glutamate epimerase-like enolase superfamily enzyme
VHPRNKPIRFENGCVITPSGPGLGIEIDPEEIESLTEAKEVMA